MPLGRRYHGVAEVKARNGRPGYSRAHFDRVTNAGNGNPATTNEQKIQTWRDLKAAHPGNADVAATCDALIREHGGEP